MTENTTTKVFSEDPTEKSIQLLSQILLNMYDKNILGTKGIFRESGSFSKIEEWVKSYEKGEVQSLDDLNVEDVAGIFLHYFHTLPKSLVTVDQVEDYCKIINTEEKFSKMAENFLQNFSTNEYISYGLLFSLLNKIHSNSKQNQMTSDNLGICFVPFLIQQKSKVASKEFLKNLLNGKTLIIFFIEYYEEIFDSELIKSQYEKYSSIPLEVTKTSEKSSMKHKTESFSHSPVTTQNQGIFKRLKRGSMKSNPNSSSSTSLHVITSKYNPSTSKYTTIWNENIYVMTLDEEKFKDYFSDIIVHLNKVYAIQNRKHLLKTYSNCFICSEVAEWLLFWNLKYHQDKFGKLIKQDIVHLLQLLTDLEAIEHVSDKDRLFQDDGAFFRFTKPVSGSKLLDSDFVTKITENFKQFKIVHKFIQSSESVKDFYDLAFAGDDGLDIRNRTYHLKTYRTVFLGSETVSWIKKKYENLGLSRYGATVLGECFRQLKAFDHSHCDHPLRDDHLFYKMREEEEFLIQILAKYEDDLD
eukprot:gene5896-9724_t